MWSTRSRWSVTAARLHTEFSIKAIHASVTCGKIAIRPSSGSSLEQFIWHAMAHVVRGWEVWVQPMFAADGSSYRGVPGRPCGSELRT
jgi:hypothetical protein